MQIVECVPNISEGRRPEIYHAVADAAATVSGVTVLNVDPGADTNRTVITFVGAPDAVLEAAFRLVKKGIELIDMTTHRGAHPRIGAVDVVPFIPVANVTMDDCAELARKLAQRVGEELGVPAYLYEHAASAPHRRNLADIREGEYEGCARKLMDPLWQPDHGPCEFVPKSGAVVIGARKFLVAYNVNLNTLDKRLANRVAFDVRERGRVRRDENDQPLLDEQGNPLWEPGLLKSVKAVGWVIPEFGCAQISINLTDLDVAPLHVVFDACEERARERGLRITGSEIVGLVPLQVLLDAGRHYIGKMGRPTGVPESALVHIAIRTLGLSEVKPFDPKERVIEYRLNPLPPRLASMSLRDFLDALSDESPAPGGGSVSALAAACAAGLASMVAVLSHTKKGFEAKHAELDRIAIRSQELKDQMLAAVDADTAAFDTLLEAMRMPKSTPEEEAVRDEALANATVGAAEVPLRVLEACPELIELNREIARIGMQASLSDAGVGAQAARAAAAGAYQNVCINLAGLSDAARKKVLLDRADAAWAKSRELHLLAEEEILVKLRTALS
ncbi:MAG: glutamate formiminotransferase / formiminotetrahydrofolate cyclodeaminase [Acidobacteriota bacterium]|jgi:glutamate formiminotransferase/formiminotetrahydrofolate cyclodeaminase|nr:glutamate formiminotransferase / formiminotetrahydrofolate cyclodeaminase [Acidobacteriota bacterium]